MAMLVEYLDSFDYDEADLATRSWTVSAPGALEMATTSVITGYASGHFTSIANAPYIERTITARASYSFRLRVKISRANMNTENLIAGLDSGTRQIIVSGISSSGTLIVQHGGGGTLITATNAIPDDNEHDIELTFTIANSGGAAELFVDGVSKGSFSGDTQQTANASVNQIRIGYHVSNDLQWYFDDLRIYYPSTGGPTALGPSRVYRKDVTGDTAQEDWTPSTGSDSYAMVDEQSSDGDTTYLSTATDAHKTRLTGDAVEGTVGTVLGWQAVAIARKTDANSRDILVGATDSGGSNEEKSAAQALTSAFKGYYHSDVDYPGGSGLVASNISDMELVIEANQ